MSWMRLDSSDVKILACLGEYGPRNVTDVARRLSLNCETVRKRVKRMASRFFLTFHANVYHTNLGLKKAFVFAEAVPGHEEGLFNGLKANDFWIYAGRCYGRYEGCYGIYTVPKGKTTEFEEFVHQLEKTGIAQRAQHFWSTCLHTVNLTEKWFDHRSEAWVFPWDEWLKEIPTEGTELPYTLRDPKDFPITADHTDVLILTELEVDGTVSMSEIARTLKKTPEAVLHHYKNHILKRGLIEKFQPFLFRFDRETSDFLVFVFKFDGGENMARFASSLLDKPFVYTIGKILGESSLVAHICLPRQEFRRFVLCLSKLVRSGFLKNYEYVIEEFERRKAQTISYEFFRDDTWIYDHAKHIKRLQELAEQRNLEVTTSAL